VDKETLVFREVATNWVYNMSACLPEPMLTGFRIDPCAPAFFGPRDLITIQELAARQEADLRTINSTSVRMLNFYETTTAEAFEMAWRIARTASLQNARDLWVRYGQRSGWDSIHLELSHLKHLSGTYGDRMVIHADDIHTKTFNVNRYLSGGQSTAFPRHGSAIADAFNIVRELDLDEVELEKKVDPTTYKIADTNLRQRFSQIPIPKPKDMQDMQSTFVLPGGSASFWSCVFHTVPIPSLTDVTGKQPDNGAQRDVLFHSFNLKTTQMSKRSKDYVYTPSVICDHIYGRYSNESRLSIEAWKRLGLDQEKYYTG